VFHFRVERVDRRYCGVDLQVAEPVLINVIDLSNVMLGKEFPECVTRADVFEFLRCNKQLPSVIGQQLETSFEEQDIEVEPAPCSIELLSVPFLFLSSELRDRDVRRISII